MRLRAKLLANPLLSIAFLLLFVGVAAAAVPAFQASERASFCRSCHEMGPYYDAWTAGPHRAVQCVDCHVDAGALNHVSHKVVAAKELWIHLTGDPRFPNGTAVVPDARCLGCHAAIPQSTGPRFSHRAHATTGGCVTCHRDAGHRVTIEALDAAGALRPGLAATTTAPAGSAASSSTAHVAVSCTSCHALAKTACALCHQPAHADRGACSQCHHPGTRWTFTHPASPSCTSCHAAPTKHFGASCGTCHDPGTPFARTEYTHTSAACADCHTAPAGHARAVACAACHTKPGTSWAFSHPSSSACGSCHKAPARHFGASCSTCHRPGVPFAKAVYRHTSSACASCHKAPSGHSRAASCATCHKKAGVSWAARHPASSACASCHKAPTPHYGTSCASCHRPMTAWRSATFKHAAIRGGEHTYRSFACAKCHPSGYSSYTCIACHDSARGDD